MLRLHPIFIADAKAKRVIVFPAMMPAMAAIFFADPDAATHDSAAPTPFLDIGSAAHIAAFSNAQGPPVFSAGHQAAFSTGAASAPSLRRNSSSMAEALSMEVCKTAIS